MFDLALVDAREPRQIQTLAGRNVGHAHLFDGAARVRCNVIAPSVFRPARKRAKVRDKLNQRRTQVLKNAGRCVDIRFAAVPRYQLRRSLELDDRATQGCIRVGHAGLGAYEIPDVSCLEFFDDEAMITVDVDAIVLGRWVAVRDEPGRDLHMYVRVWEGHVERDVAWGGNRVGMPSDRTRGAGPACR